MDRDGLLMMRFERSSAGGFLCNAKASFIKLEVRYSWWKNGNGNKQEAEKGLYRALSSAFCFASRTTGALSALLGFAPRKGPEVDMMILTMDGQNTMLE